MDADIVVVGGGPIGCHTARLLSRRFDVLVVEEHREVGRPVQCTGLVSPQVLELADVRPRAINSLKGAAIHFPGGCELRIASNETKGVVIDRGEFDRLICAKAKDAGASFIMEARAEDVQRTDGGVICTLNDGRKLTSELLVGADGHRSAIADMIGAGAPKEYVYGIQMDIVHSMEEQSIVDIHVGNAIAPGFFAWCIPCGDFTRVGLCVSEGQGAPNGYLRGYLEMLGLERADGDAPGAVSYTHLRAHET